VFEVFERQIMNDDMYSVFSIQIRSRDSTSTLDFGSIQL